MFLPQESMADWDGGGKKRKREAIISGLPVESDPFRNLKYCANFHPVDFPTSRSGASGCG